ncbi:hypothetical protein [Mesorhizobium sp. M0816]|uniref:hypothetical protein n=1 Tax=Mesorhizobium sp. M0816 TaxID=2957006 RepID=UPI003339DBC9
MTSARFQLKQILDGLRPLSAQEREAARSLLLRKIELVEMGDDIVPDRKLYAPKANIEARLLEGCLGVQGPTNGTWTEEMFDAFFRKHFVGGCYLWVESLAERSPEPVFWAPYSPERRDWLYVYASELGMRPCGMMRADGRLAICADLDCDFTFVFGEFALIEIFDKAFGGRKKLCEEFLDFLETNEVDLGKGNIYEFMKVFLPKIIGCAR